MPLRLTRRGRAVVAGAQKSWFAGRGRTSPQPPEYTRWWLACVKCNRETHATVAEPSQGGASVTVLSS